MNNVELNNGFKPQIPVSNQSDGSMLTVIWQIKNLQNKLTSDRSQIINHYFAIFCIVQRPNVDKCHNDYTRGNYFPRDNHSSRIVEIWSFSWNWKWLVLKMDKFVFVCIFKILVPQPEKATTSEATVSIATAENSALINAVISLSVLSFLLILALILLIFRHIHIGQKVK